MKYFLVLCCLCIVFLQLAVCADDTGNTGTGNTGNTGTGNTGNTGTGNTGNTGTGNTGSTETTTTTAAPLQTPRRPINVQRYRPRAQEFLTNLDPINSQIFSVMSGGSIEPKICEQIRKYLNFNMKIFYEYIFKDDKRFMATAMTSKSDKLNETIFEVQQAYSYAIGNMTLLANNFLNETNTKCANISSVQTLGAINKKVGELRAIQLSTATQLAALPQKYENEMQSNYVPVENIVGPV